MLSDRDAAATIAVRDAKSAKKFYEGALGLKPVDSGEDSVLKYKSGNSILLVYESQFAGTKSRDIGVRLALGADPGRVRREIVGQGMRVAAAGAAGLAAAFLLTRLMSAVLSGVAPTDPATYAGVALLLLSIAFGASDLPARRAARLDPLRALRSE